MMTRILGKYEPYFYAILRIVSGFLFALHGAQKLFGFPPSGKRAAPLNAMITTAGVVELIAGLMILFGLFASIAAFIASGQMAVAYFMAHQPQGALPLQNGGDAAVLFCFIFLYIAARGSGVLNLDSAFNRNTSAAGNNT
ncbi:MAG TPA: DoxX family protein [Pyrinomonadaceae bacterium]